MTDDMHEGESGEGRDGAESEETRAGEPEARPEPEAAQTAADAERRAEELFAPAETPPTEPSQAVETPPPTETPAPTTPPSSPPPSIVLSPPSIFRDRDLTPIEQTRMAVSSKQPKPWEPSDADLDPDSDAGWDRAAGHELIAVRPEDVVAAPAFAPAAGMGGASTTAAAGTPAQPAPAPGETGFHALPTYDANAQTQRYVAPATSTLAWQKGGGPSGPQPSVPQAASDAAVSTSAAFTPFTPAAPSPLLTPIPNAAQLAAADVAATTVGGAAGAPAIADAVAAPAARRRPWTGLRGRTRKGVGAGARTIARPITLAALFILGILLGSTVWTRSQPIPQTAEALPAATHEPGTTESVPPQIQSLIAALQADDQSQIQLVVPADPYRLLAGELAGDGLTRILGATALTTYAVGPDSATEILITGEDGQGNQGTINLVVHLHNGQITDFR